MRLHVQFFQTNENSDDGQINLFFCSLTGSSFINFLNATRMVLRKRTLERGMIKVLADGQREAGDWRKW